MARFGGGTRSLAEKDLTAVQGLGGGDSSCFQEGIIERQDKESWGQM